MLQTVKEGQQTYDALLTCHQLDLWKSQISNPLKKCYTGIGGHTIDPSKIHNIRKMYASNTEYT